MFPRLPPHIRIALLFLIHGSCSISLTLLNKQIMNSISSPFFVLFIQNSATVLFSIFLWYMDVIPMNRWKRSHLIQFMLPAVIFFMVIWTSLKSMEHSSVALIIVVRNCSPLVTAIGEIAFLKTSFSVVSIVGLLISIAGSCLFASFDTSSSAVGIFWMVLNLFSVAASVLIEKKFTNDMVREQTPFGLNCYRNLLSLPILFILSISAGPSAFSLPQSHMFVLFFSCLSSCLIGMVYFFLQTHVSSTSIMVANVFYKLATTIVSLLYFSFSLSSSLGWLGYLMSLAGFVIYTQSRMPKSLPLDHNPLYARESGLSAFFRMLKRSLKLQMQ
eukprot:GILI01020675.1.p1 GENE.GILI01020675.1~~GILI01020675.1.p1  ORF type:complete len:346 (+),score=52.20 GILI01020675.1:50-1039(+)